MAASYPRSSKLTPPYESINPRPLPPIRPPSTSPRIPKLPAHIENLRRDVLNILPGFVLSTHVFPASFPRTKCGPESIPKFSKEHEKRMEEASVAAKGLLELRCHQFPVIYEDTEEKEEPLWLSVNRFYRPGGLRVATGKKALTLWLLHANGFHKEVSCCYYLWIWSHIYMRGLKTWEETLKYSVSGEPAASLVEEIWVYDAVNMGDSALLNEGRLGNICRHQRDLITFAHLLTLPS